METLKLETPSDVTWSYDEEADVLYISFGKPRVALTMDMGRGVLARYVKESGKLVGFTIIGMKDVRRVKK